MITDIVANLLKESRFEEALIHLHRALKQPVDFSNDTERELFLQVNELLETTQTSYLAKVNEELAVSGTRSASATVASIKSPTSAANSGLFLDSLRSIRIEKYEESWSLESDAYILVLMNTHSDQKIFQDFKIDPSEINGIPAEKYTSNLTEQEKMICYLNPNLENDEINPLLALYGFAKAISALSAQGFRDISIIISFLPHPGYREIQKILIGYYLWQVLLTINSRASSIPTVYTFLFENELCKVLFEKIILRLNSPEKEKPGGKFISEDALENLCVKALTKNKNYREQLKGLLRIINEDDIAILLSGETGVGKTRLAKIIHDLSIRTKAPFEELNCGGLAVDKLEQKLFGWKKGAFTGALYDYKGKITRAEKGTLFLDELDRMTRDVRNALLTFIENRNYEVLGDEKTRRADVRLIYGTNKDLRQQVDKGEFEEDFYYRVSERILRIPPLRERVEDVELITEFSLNAFSVENDRLVTIEPPALRILQEHSWPGNVRELVFYLKQRFYDCVGEGSNKITTEMLRAYPFENIPKIREDDFELLMELIKKFLEHWDIRKGAFLDDFVAPIIAKQYIDETFRSMNRTKKFEAAMDIIGISGTRFKASTLQQAYDKFADLQDRLGP